MIGVVELHAVLGIQPFVLRVADHTNDRHPRDDRVALGIVERYPLADRIHVRPVPLHHLLIHDDRLRTRYAVLLREVASLEQRNLECREEARTHRALITPRPRFTRRRLISLDGEAARRPAVWGKWHHRRD